MDTLGKENELIELLVEKINQATSDDVMVIKTTDYTEERNDYMVAIGVSQVVPAHPDNPMLPDYQYTLGILVDCFITDDKEGYKFEKTKQEVTAFLEPYLKDRTKLEELFEDIPVVGFFLTGLDNSSNEESNKALLTFRVVVSY